jgi:enoyl-CoA hydratase
MSYQYILYDIEDRLATITLNRPEQRNALNWPLLEELSDALKKAEKDREVRVIIIKGAGPCFSAGHDLSETMGAGPRQLDPRTWNRIVREQGEGVGVSVWDSRARVQDHLDYDLQIWNCWKPVIAQVHSYCLGGSTGIALSCDLLVASKDARLGYPPVRAMAPGEEISLFSWHVGLKRAKWLSLTGDSLTAKEMLDYGVANWVFPREKLDAETRKIARRIANIDPELLSLSKTLVNRIFEQKGYSHSLKSSGEIVSFGPQLKSLRNFEKMVHEKGIRAAAEERDRPFGGIVGRYPPPAED